MVASRDAAVDRVYSDASHDATAAGGAEVSDASRSSVRWPYGRSDEPARAISVTCGVTISSPRVVSLRVDLEVPWWKA
jgi:hypothetical protein